MISGDRDTQVAVTTLTLTACAMIGYQMAAKATRDALFLSSFDVSVLPLMVMTSALLSVGLAFLFSRAMTSLGPARLVPIVFATSALLLLAEWGFLAQFQRQIAVVVYLHYGGLGALLVSGFWSIVNERFDPRTAKRQVSRIAAGATIGGLLGGVLAERAAVMLSVAAMLPILAVLHLFCAWMVFYLRSTDTDATKVRDQAPQDNSPPTNVKRDSGLKIIANTPYLRNLVALVLLATVCEVLIDYVFKARASQAFGRGEDLLRLFALFYTGVALLTVVAQALASRIALQRLGLARTVALLPSALAVGGTGALLAPGLVSALIARAAEAITRNSLYRPAYELLFTPVAPRQKRATKTLVDVGVVRVGDMTGAAIVQVTLLVAAGGAVASMLGIAIALSVVAVLVAVQLHRGYVRTLERSLVSRGALMDFADVDDIATRTALLQTVGAMELAPQLNGTPTPVEEQTEVPEETRGDTGIATSPTETRLDPEVRRIIELRSRDPERVKQALATGSLSPTLVSHAVPLLAWEEVVSEVITALRRVVSSVTGQLVDRLLDPDEEFAVRRRIPLVLAFAKTDRAFEGLFRGLEDKRFEVRYRCGRALCRVVELNPQLDIDRKRVAAAVLREVAVDRGVWESHRLLDQMEDDDWSPMADEVLRDRASRSLEQVFTVLSLILPKEPLRIAFQGLHTNDKQLRGTALEYLEMALPTEIRGQLWPFLEDSGPRPESRRSSAQVLASLLESNASIAINLEELRRKSQGS